MSRHRHYAWAALALMGFATNAFADPAVWPGPTWQPLERYKIVRFSDLDLNSQAGAEAMLARLHDAARRACDDWGPAIPELAERQEAQACVRAAMDDAVTRLDAPLVTARYYRTVPPPPDDPR